MNKYVAVVVAVLIASVAAVPTPTSENLDCLKSEDMLSCFAVKAVSTLDRAARSADIAVFEGVAFIRETPVERLGKSLKTETEVLSELPRDATDKTITLVSMLFDSAMSFLKTHSLKVNVPEGASVSRSLVEGRAKIKKVFLPLIAGIGLKLFALVPIILGGLALLVVKAVVVGKIALLIAAVLAFQRLFGGGAHGGIGGIGSGISGGIFGKNPQPWYDGNQGGWNSGAASSQSQGYYRSFSDKPVDETAAQSLAYSAHAPNTNEAN